LTIRKLSHPKESWRVLIASWEDLEEVGETIFSAQKNKDI